VELFSGLQLGHTAKEDRAQRNDVKNSCGEQLSRGQNELMKMEEMASSISH